MNGLLPTTLVDGTHVVHVHARDAAGWWGPWATVSFLVDRSPPVLSGAAARRTRPLGRRRSPCRWTPPTARASRRRGSSRRASACPRWTARSPLSTARTVGRTEHLSVSIDVGAWRWGQHLLTVLAADVAGRSAAPVFVSVDVGPADLVFSDGFETGATARWSRAYGGSRLQTTNSDVLVGGVALRATITGASPSYVQTDSPAAESSYRARFWFDPNGTRTRSAGHDVLAGLTGSGSPAFRVRLPPDVGGDARAEGGGRAVRWPELDCHGLPSLTPRTR